MGEKRKEYEELIVEKKLDKHVALLGAIPTPSTGATLLKAFDIFVFPSTKEGLPYAIIEAGAAGVAILSSNVGGIPEIIQHEKNGLLSVSKSGEALAYHIEKMFYDERVRGDYTRAMEDTIATTFSLPRALDQTFLLYD